MNELHEYVRTRSQSAFAALVERYVDLVYASAVRHVGDRDLAQDVTQAVFTLLVQKADKVPPDRPVSAWLLTATRYVSMNERRLRANRAKLEQTVAAMKQDAAAEDRVDWAALGPLVDEGLSKLGEADRDALMLRFFECRSLREVAAAMNVSEEAATKRVQRALERLRAFFRRRGVTAADVTPALTMLATASAAPAALRATLVALGGAKSSAGAVVLGAITVTAGKAAAVAAAVLIACCVGVVAYTRTDSTAPAAPVASATTRTIPAAATTTSWQNPADREALLAAKRECYPKEVCDVLLAERMRVSILLALRGESLNTQAYSIDADGMGWLAMVFSEAGNMEKVLRPGSGTSTGLTGIFTESGVLLPVQRVRIRRDPFEVFSATATVTEPWAPLEPKKFCWLIRDGQHSPRDDGRYRFFTSNMPGMDCTQQLALVTSKHWRLQWSSERPALTKTAGESVVYFWEKRVKADERYRVDAVIERAKSK
jgi:RNA polymerase sigma factor (sigma-70 family)